MLIHVWRLVYSAQVDIRAIPVHCQRKESRLVEIGSIQTRATRHQFKDTIRDDRLPHGLIHSPPAIIFRWLRTESGDSDKVKRDSLRLESVLEDSWSQKLRPIY